jgi:hypothetical protein
MKKTSLKKTSFIALLLAAALSLTACSYKKPERYTVQTLGADSITTVCGTDCNLSDIEVATAGSNCSASYTYTNVADEKGVSDAKTYHDYLAGESTCVKIDDFSEESGSYTAYFGETDAIESTDTEDEDGEEKVALGISIKVTFTADSYTIVVTDNINLDEILDKQSAQAATE